MIFADEVSRDVVYLGLKELQKNVNKAKNVLVCGKSYRHAESTSALSYSKPDTDLVLATRPDRSRWMMARPRVFSCSLLSNDG